ncbi:MULTISPECIES: hypothetical protein [Piscirickettsiaceae]|jgi:hypothetical protein|uniref:Uncharacterized protein n=1 Tax=Hydrogenovibrio thermophilus TaxID=265883 RepID=A0A410H416_9GAMM|nr:MULTISPECIES: hypothetical protein [Piscirickettsiaceae]AZR81806.1 hypothetical protein AYJ59_05620 [Thiomicrospira sp. S5]QAB15665.1 hypothetical protein EPV75_08285 [Hydrogenovibrio thermophilus]
MLSIEPGARQTYIEHLCFIIPLKPLRNTPNVQFFSVEGVTDGLAGVDLVIHEPGGKSPLIAGDDTWYWYMHTDQEDKLVVHQGKRLVELYSEKHGQVERFEVTADAVYHNGEKIHDGAAILGWEPYVFHRVHSPEGSLSTNYAKRLQGFDIDTNFNIYQLDTESGAYDVARLGALDQP